MANDKLVKVPDIGGATGVDVIEVMVKVGDIVTKDTPLITLESDKASMEIPSPHEGVVAEVFVKLGDKVSEGDAILALSAGASSKAPVEEPQAEVSAPAQPMEEKVLPAPITPSSEEAAVINVVVPDIGGATGVDVIEVMIKPNQHISKDEAVITLEGEKATMEIPSPHEGEVVDVIIKVGDKVSQGDVIFTLKTKARTPSVTPAQPSIDVPVTSEEKAVKPLEQAAPSSVVVGNGTDVLATPSVRRLARELGVALDKVKGTGRKGRLTKEDLHAYVKQKLNEKPVSSGFGFEEAPSIDFSKFGPIEVKPLSKIKRLTGINVHRSWVTIPQVTQFDEADVTDLEQFRKAESKSAEVAGYKLTMLAFVCKAVAKALKAFPSFNASLDKSGENLILKDYVNIGIAVDTPNGLVVPVITNVDARSISDVAREMARLSQKARDKGLSLADMSGGCFTISSLGGIGGTAFTPIVNAPEVAILGLSRTSMKPVYDGKGFVPRLMLPLSLSYDHRVIDGAEAARFTRYIAEQLNDIRRVLL